MNFLLSPELSNLIPEGNLLYFIALFFEMINRTIHLKKSKCSYYSAFLKVVKVLVDSLRFTNRFS